MKEGCSFISCPSAERVISTIDLANCVLIEVYVALPAHISVQRAKQTSPQEIDKKEVLDVGFARRLEYFPLVAFF